MTTPGPAQRRTTGGRSREGAVREEIRTVRDLRRSQIVSAARALVAHGGLEALTIGALEKRLDFTRGVITYHFRDKDEIVAAVLDSAVEEIDAATHADVRASATAEERVRAVITSKVRGFLDHAEARAILVSFWSLIPGDPRATAVNSRLYTNWRQQAATLVRAGQAQEWFDPAVPADAIGALMVGTVVGIVVQAGFEPESVDAEALIDEATAMLMARLRPR